MSGIHGYNAYHMLMNCVIIGSCNGMLSVRHQSIIWTDIVNWTQRSKLRWNLNHKYFLFWKLILKCLQIVGILVRLDQNGQHFAEEISQCFCWKTFCALLRSYWRGPIGNSALVKVKGWCWTREHPLTELIMNRLLKQICMTKPLNSSMPSDAQIRH